MARDKLITIRIEGDKREAFNNLAKSQNTDTASLLYDFISGCLDGRIDIKLVTGKGNRLDNQIDSDRLDKLETDTQRLDHWIGALSERLNDWIEAIDDRLTDSDQGLTNRMISLEHRLSTLSIQLDSQKIDGIDTDSQQIDDMEPLIKKALRLDFMDDQKLIDAIESQIEDTEIDESDYESVTSPLPIIEETVEATIDKVEAVYTVESVDKTDSTDKPGTDAIGPVGMTAMAAAKYLKAKKVKVSYDSLHRWGNQGKIPNTSPQGRDARKHLILRDKLYYPIN